MPKGKAVTDDLRGTIVRMEALGDNMDDIALRTGVTVRQCQRILKQYRATRTVAASRTDRRGWCRVLTDNSMSVSVKSSVLIS